MPAGRPKGIWTPEIVRQRIRVAKLAARLQRHALGEVEMTPTQVRAAEIMLKKVMPDLSQVEHSGMMHHSHAKEMTDSELERIASGSSSGVADAQASPDQPTDIH